jgi:hypothetical protein
MLNYIDMINEFFLLATGYAMIVFSEWTYNPVIGTAQEYQNDPLIKYNQGYTYIGFLILILAANIFFILFEQ